jgi:CheY-like chemotaxis protein
LDEALAVLACYAEAAPRKLVVALPESVERGQLIALLESERLTPVFAPTPAALLSALGDGSAHAIVIDQPLFELCEREIEETLAQRNPFAPIPVIVHSPDGDAETSVHAFDHFTRHTASDVDHLLDAIVASLHFDKRWLAEPARDAIGRLHGSNAALSGRKALIVDDDMRNIFALATVLEDHGMRHVWADNGRDAIRLVEADPEIEIVLMDIMMPEMDGLTTMREIRMRPVGRTLPIIAVTAKAMKGDRERCIEAGAWDYLSKPVNREDLLAVLHAWLHR